MVDGNNVLQSIRGFGASSAWSDCGSCGGMTNAQIQTNAGAFFGTGNGQIGLSMLRLRIPPVQSQWAGTFAPALLASQTYGVTQVLSTAWTPPANWKANNAVTNGDASNNPDPNGYLLPANYANYANYLRDYANAYRTAVGIDLYSISPANEPDWYVTYDGCTWSGNQFRDFLMNNMGPTFQAAGLSTRIILPESFRNDCAYADPTMANATARNYLFAVGMHHYGGGPNVCTSMNGLGKEFWQTERSSFEAYDATMTHGLVTASWIHSSLVNASYNAWLYWWLGSDNGNEGLMSKTQGTPKRFWVMGNYSKFIRPGYTRIGATANPTGNIFASAYKNTANTSYVIVAYNNSAGAINQTFQLNNIAVTSMTPYITDGTRDLAAQAAVTVTGGQFTYSMPARSVISFVASAPAGTPTRTPTYAGTPTRTPTPSPTPFTQLYDDFEDGNTNNNWGGTWSTYSGASSTVNVTVAGPGAPGSTVARGAVTGTINDYGGLTGSFSGSPRNLSAYVAVQFLVRGSGTYWFQIPQSSIADGDHYGQTFTATGTWTTVTLYFSNFAQRGFGASVPMDLSSIQMFQWGSNGNGAMNFEVDDVRFLTYAPPASPTATFTRTSTVPAPTATRTWTLTATRTATATHTPLPPSATSTLTATRTHTATLTSTPVPPTATATRTATATGTPVPPSATSTLTATRTATPSGTPTLSATRSPTGTMTGTPLPTLTATQTHTPPPPASTFTATPTQSPLPSSTGTRSATGTSTPVPPTLTATRTGTGTLTQTSSASPTSSWSPSATRTASPLPTLTVTQTQSPLPSLTATRTGTPLPTLTITETDTPVPPLSTFTATPTQSSLPTLTGTRTVTATQSPVPPSPTLTATQSSTPLPTLTVTQTQSPLPSLTETLTGTPVPTLTITGTDTPVPPLSTRTPTPTQSPLPTLSASPTATRTHSPIATVTPLPTSTPTSSASPTTSWSPTATLTATITLTQTSTATRSATPTATASATASATPVVPALVSLNAAGNSPGGGFIVDVTGSNFLPGAVVLIDGSPVATTYVNATTLSFTAPAHAPGSAVLQVQNPNGLSAPSPLSLLYVAPTGTATRTPSFTVTLTPQPTQASGLVEVERVVPIPNPNPTALKVLLKGTADSVTVKVWTRAFSLMAQESFAGPQGPGWVTLALPPGFLGNARSGTYFLTLTAYKGGQPSAKVPPVKFMVLK